MYRIQRNLLRVDTTDYAPLARLLLTRVDISVILRMAGVLPCDLVEVLHRALANQFSLAAYLKVATGIFRVNDQQADLGIPRHVPALLAFERGIDAGALAVVVTPNDAGLRLAVGHHGRQYAVDGTGQQVEVGGGDFKRHVCILVAR